MTDPVKLIAFDEKDLEVVSSLVQDGVVSGADIDFNAGSKRFVVMVNRFRWEKKRRFFKPRGERIRAALQFNQVLKVAFKGFDPKNHEGFLSLLALRMVGEDTVIMEFSGGAGIRLQLDGLDVMLSDLGDEWEAVKRPDHKGT